MNAPALSPKDQADEEESRRRVERRLELERHMTAATLADLSGAVQGRSMAPDSSLLGAVRLAAQAMGLEVLPALNIGPREHPLTAIASASHFRVRRVRLLADWRRRDNGCLVAYRSEDQSPVALVPKRGIMGGWRYELIDPVDQRATAVTEDVADSLEPAAFSLYKPFGADTGAWDLLQFALRPYRRDFGVVVGCGIAVGLLGLAVPPATSLLFGEAIPDADRSLVWQVTLGMAVALLGTAFFSLAQQLSTLRLQSGMSIALQCGVWDRLLKLRTVFFRRFSAGDLWSRLDALEKIRRQITASVMTSAFAGVVSLCNVALMFSYSAPLATIACLTGLIIFVVTGVTARRMYRLEAGRQELEGFLSGFVVQLVNAAGKLRVAGAERRAFACWGRSYSRKQRTTLDIRRTRDKIHVLNTTLPVIATALLLAWMVRGPEGMQLPIGTYLAFTASFGAFLAGVVSLSDTVMGVGITTIWSRVQPILAEELEVAGNKRHPGILLGHVKFDHVSFRYLESGPLTLADIHIEVEPGECVALVGPSGSGKSTLLNLLLQFETPASGAIYLDGQDLSGLDIGAVRRQMGVVNQDSRLIAQSIFENISCGGRCTLEEAWEAARAAAIADDIEQMPMGMNTMVSEGGTNVSGGQRQRLLIARALVRKPALLIFDEATSALDNRTQAIVTESLKRLGVTRILVAQRLSTIRDADRIYVIESGRVVQCGTYAGLASGAGPFARLVRRQV